ncbi:MAG: isochorismatase family cysteine hydrolase [Bryobacteraceae bacterium]
MSTLFFDVDTQIDFLYPAGALYVPGAEAIVATVARLNLYAADHGIPLLSTLDTHAEDDPEFRAHGFQAHCVRGTAGWNKPASTLVGQTLFEKNTFDAFTNLELVRWVKELAPDRVAVYGVVTEICVAEAVRGLVRTLPGARVELVEDAVKALSEAKRDEFLAWLGAHGGATTTAAAICR